MGKLRISKRKWVNNIKTDYKTAEWGGWLGFIRLM